MFNSLKLIKIMKYFTKQEMIRCYRENKQQRCKECRLTTAVKRAPNDVDANIEALVDNILDPAREHYGKPIYVNSGFRCPLHNTTVGGVRASQHIQGEAADITAGSPEENHQLAKIIVQQGKFDQLILENTGEKDLLPQWVHVSYSRRCNRGQVLKKIVGKVGYQALTVEEIKCLLW